MLGLYVVLSVIVLGVIIGVCIALKFERFLDRQKREAEDSRIKEELSKQEQKRSPQMEQEEKQTTARNDDEEKLKWWYSNLNLDEEAVKCGFNMLQLYFASVNGATKPFKKKLNQLTRLNHYYK
jgi:hypothetical protein